MLHGAWTPVPVTWFSNENRSLWSRLSIDTKRLQ
jgi:hypothetical protein